jgi:hypothetical protein
VAGAQILLQRAERPIVLEARFRCNILLPLGGKRDENEGGRGRSEKELSQRENGMNNEGRWGYDRSEWMSNHMIG